MRVPRILTSSSSWKPRVRSSAVRYLARAVATSIILVGSINQPGGHCICKHHVNHVIQQSNAYKIKCGVNSFILGSRRVLAPQHQRCWDQNTSQIQILRHFEKRGAIQTLRLAGHQVRMKTKKGRHLMALDGGVSVPMVSLWCAAVWPLLLMQVPEHVLQDVRSPKP